MQPDSGSELRHHVSAAVHGDERESLGVRRDVSAELRPRVHHREVRPEEQRFLRQHGDGRRRGVEKIGALPAPAIRGKPTASIASLVPSYDTHGSVSPLNTIVVLSLGAR